MRSWVALLVSVATLASPSVEAATFSGECAPVIEPQLEELSFLLAKVVPSQGSCEASNRTSFTPDMRVITTEVSRPAFEGAREFGQPSGERKIVQTSWSPTVIADEDIAPRPIFAINRFEPYRKAREIHEASTSLVHDAVAVPAGNAYGKISVVRAEPWQKWRAKNMTGLIDAAVDMSLMSTLVLASGGVGIAYQNLRSLENVWNSPLDVSEGSSEMVDGVRTRDFDRALDGYTEACSGAITALSIAVPLSKAPRSIRPTRVGSTPYVVNGVTVVDSFTGKTLLQGPIDVAPTIQRIRSKGSFPHRNDGSVFKNTVVKGRTVPELPVEPYGYYREYVHPTPGVKGAGPQRVVVGQSGEIYYTPDHYKSFIRLH